MTQMSRRLFLRSGTMGLAAMAAGGGWALRADAQPTPGSGDPAQGPPAPEPFAATEPNILGPFHRGGAPFRAKVTPPLVAGTVLVIQGRVWSFALRKPIAHAVLDIWQADATGRYDNDDPANPPAANVFANRARVVTDEAGYYEFETVHPGRYPLNATRLRPAHIHYRVTAPEHRTLVTQLYFEGDPQNEGDPFIRPSLIIALAMRKAGAATYESGVFDLVLTHMDQDG